MILKSETPKYFPALALKLTIAGAQVPGSK